MDPEQLAYVAGLLDAIGRIRVRELANGTRLASVGISSPNMPLLRHMAELTGVGLTTVQRDYQRLGCGEHCQKPHLHVVSVTGRWEVTGARAQVVLRATRPYLVTRAADADHALAVAEDAPRKGATLRKMADLGWALGCRA
jgi:hypothetical protein